MRPIAGDFWGLRLHLAATVHALPIGWAPAGAKADEREVFEDILGQLPPDLAARVLALTTVVWHNDPIGAPVLRSLTAYDTETPDRALHQSSRRGVHAGMGEAGNRNNEQIAASPASRFWTWLARSFTTRQRKSPPTDSDSSPNHPAGVNWECSPPWR